MKINRKYITILSIAVASVLTVSIILFFTDASNRSGRNHRMNDEQGVAASLEDDLLHTSLNEQRIIVLDPSIQLR
ncbi:hypothetical protein ABER23_20975 [Paenibacillus lautus]|uniref:hypothetical protein n=1 Tax=Paenibacillus lautus TaxID=1401 RepID=UPI003D280741